MAAAGVPSMNNLFDGTFNTPVGNEPDLSESFEDSLKKMMKTPSKSGDGQY